MENRIIIQTIHKNTDVSIAENLFLRYFSTVQEYRIFHLKNEFFFKDLGEVNAALADYQEEKSEISFMRYATESRFCVRFPEILPKRSATYHFVNIFGFTGFYYNKYQFFIGKKLYIIDKETDIHDMPYYIDSLFLSLLK